MAYALQEQMHEIVDAESELQPGTQVWHAHGGLGVVEVIDYEDVRGKPYSVRCVLLVNGLF